MEEKKEEHKKFKRDTNTPSEYYKAWDKYDVDAECEKVDQDTDTVKDASKVMFGENYDPRKEVATTNRNGSSNNTNVEMLVKGGRGQGLFEIEQKKDQGNLCFRNNEYQKAVILYHTCIDALVPLLAESHPQAPPLASVVYSNLALVRYK